MRLRRSSIALFENDVESVTEHDARENGTPQRQRLYFYVKLPQEFGGNRSGHCNGVQIHRSGTLIIHGDGDSKRTHLAAGSWSDLVTEPPRGDT